MLVPCLDLEKMDFSFRGGFLLEGLRNSTFYQRNENTSFE